MIESPSEPKEFKSQPSKEEKPLEIKKKPEAKITSPKAEELSKKPIKVEEINVQVVDKSSSDDSSVQMSFQSVRVEMQDRVNAANFRVEKKHDQSDSIDIGQPDSSSEGMSGSIAISKLMQTNRSKMGGSMDFGTGNNDVSESKQAFSSVSSMHNSDSSKSNDSDAKMAAAMKARRDAANDMGKPSGNDTSMTQSKQEFSSVLEPDSEHSEEDSDAKM